MYYNWNKSDVERSLDQLTSLIIHEQDADKREYYSKVLTVQEEIFFSTYVLPQMKGGFLTANDRLAQMAMNITSYSRQFCEFEEINNKLDHLLPKVYEIAIVNDDYQELFQLKEYIKHENAFEILKSFFGNLDNELYKYYMNLHNDRFRSFIFFKDDLSEEKGSCNYVDGINRFFIRIANEKGINKLSDMVHECGHAISLQMNPRSWYCSSKNFGDEIESIFLELVLNHELKGFFSDYKLNLLNFDFLHEKLDTIKQILWHEAIVDLWYENKYKVDKNFYRLIKERYQLSKRTVSMINSVSLKNNGPYVKSYFIALKLFNIYKQDKKAAIDLYKRILMIDYNLDFEGEVAKLIDYSDTLVNEVEQNIRNMELSLKNHGVNL